MNPRVSDELAEARRRAKNHVERLKIHAQIEEDRRSMSVVVYMVGALVLAVALLWGWFHPWR